MRLDFNDKTRSIRSQWARNHASIPLRRLINHPPPHIPGHLDGGWPGHVGDDEELPKPPKLKKPVDGTAPITNPTVAIVGAGAAGLFTAMILDYLNENVAGFNASYDIYEASQDSSRLGGRLFTYNFGEYPDPKHNYFDVGAMRFPDASDAAPVKNPIMQR